MLLSIFHHRYGYDRDNILTVYSQMDRNLSLLEQARILLADVISVDLNQKQCLEELIEGLNKLIREDTTYRDRLLDIATTSTSRVCGDVPEKTTAAS